jgi:hypothetical protein
MKTQNQMKQKELISVIICHMYQFSGKIANINMSFLKIVFDKEMPPLLIAVFSLSKHI